MWVAYVTCMFNSGIAMGIANIYWYSYVFPVM